MTADLRFGVSLTTLEDRASWMDKCRRAEDLGFQLGREELDALYLTFTALADRKKGVGNEEIVSLIREVVGETAAAAND